ncbi:Large ribosomal subunit protein bL21-like - like 1 [Theobroma cacao]|uniref:Large ribosomal subunit protein bL21m n=1 Tax=Theobroma cacao TaxID=3641 RepID=A0AB32V1R7_THECC|nr:PREDICTED: 50S ribosomal protein L21, mitochondrial [Theobroma cacao]WRX27446.1 Large ribosomal subunit protein bL21-like - like 1 [Theobroma cacao]
MAHRRCVQSLARHATALISLKTTRPLSTLEILTSKSNPVITITNLEPSWCARWSHSRYFSSSKSDDSENEVEMEEASDGETEDEEAASDLDRDYSPEEKEAEAAAIGYKVLGPLQRSDRVFKDYEPVFAVVQIGSHQFKVSNGDCIFTERLKFCEVNDKLILNKVLLLGSPTQTIIGRPILPDAAVHAVVEEHALDAKVIIFKKKKRKNYRRTKGHRQELTKLRITDIQGIEKPEMKTDGRPLKAAVKKPEEIVAAA